MKDANVPSDSVFTRLSLQVNSGGICVSFEAKQLVAISLLQPAQASFYDYYEPSNLLSPSHVSPSSYMLLGMHWLTVFVFLAETKCTIFYAALRRTTQVSKLCSDDVCQCAESRCSFCIPMLMTFLRLCLMLLYIFIHVYILYTVYI